MVLWERELEAAFDVFLTGGVASGTDRASAVERLASVFHLKLEVADQLVCGQPRRIKIACNKATALRLRQLLTDAGLEVSVKRSEATSQDQQLTEAISPRHEKPANFEAKPTSKPAEAPLPTEEEKVIPTSVDYQPVAIASIEQKHPAEMRATSGELVVAPVGERLAEARPDAPPFEGKLRMDLAPVGAPIPNLKKETTPINPNTDHLSVEKLK